MSEFSDGLQLNRLHPPSIIAFLQGLPRRVDERLIAAAATTPTANTTAEALQSIQDALTRAAIALKESGFAPDHDVEDHAPPAFSEDPELSRLHAAALEVTRRVAGVPDSGWTQQPELLEIVRACCADAAEHLSTIGDVDVDVERPST